MKRIISIVAALCCMFGFRFLPALPGMSASAMQVLGIFIGALILWLTISIDWPSLLCLAALSLVPELTMNMVLTHSLGKSTVAFLLFTFMCTYAISTTSFIKRCAIMFITGPLARRGAWYFLISYCASVLIIGLFMSPTVLFVIYLPILNAICEELKLRQEDKLANALIMGQLFSCAISCGMTPIAHVFSIMAMGFYHTATGKAVSYASYMGFAIPVGLLTFLVMILFFRFILRPDMSSVRNLNMDALRGTVAKADKKEKIILVIFFSVVALWVIPEFLKNLLPTFAGFMKKQGTAFPPLLGAVLLCMLTIDGKPLMNFKEMMQKGVEWGSIMMAGSTLAIGMAMTNADIGLTAWISDAIKPMFALVSPFVLVVIFAAWAAIMTNLASNMVTVTVVCAVTIPICSATGGLISTPAVAMIVGMLGGYAFAIPPAHPNVALAIGSGWTKTSQVAAYGSALMAVSIIISTFIGYPLARALMGM
ncbi:SLC13 family permease [Treponema phagedenis]|uniref:SLC13 family permease n=1 Tax=Treponema phagedenis TaxID=162 RepID=UPI000587E39F|nr:SLC13 family permease [Treponema phagedenis]TYT79297.1 SLC13 family permease [Treponema phagedenis]